jgi:predicted amidophosphoribosyltransferase
MKKSALYIDMRRLFYLLADSRCLLCQKPLSFERNSNGQLCQKCTNVFVPEKSEFFCLKCGIGIESGIYCNKCNVNSKRVYYDSYRYIQTYSGLAMQLVKLHKQHDNHGVIDLYASFLQTILNPVYPVYIVPDSLLGKIKKGRCCFSAELAHKLEKNGFSVISGIIKKSSFAKMQKLLNHKDRQSNADKIFNLSKNPPKIENDLDTIQLIDDIFTTGSTINRCSKLLKDFGFKKVFAYSLFKAKF